MTIVLAGSAARSRSGRGHDRRRQHRRLTRVMTTAIALERARRLPLALGLVCADRVDRRPNRQASLVKTAAARRYADAMLPLALENVSFVVTAGYPRWDHDGNRGGPRTVILGPNGAGKACSCVSATLLAPTEGRVNGSGQRFAAPGDVFSGPSCCGAPRSPTWSTGSSLRACIAGRSELRAHDVLEAVGLERRRGSRRLLSGGEQQKLALARAWRSGPKCCFRRATANIDPMPRASSSRSSADTRERHQDCDDTHNLARRGASRTRSCSSTAASRRARAGRARFPQPGTAELPHSSKRDAMAEDDRRARSAGAA